MDKNINYIVGCYLHVKSTLILLECCNLLWVYLECGTEAALVRGHRRMHWHQAVSRVAWFVQFSFEISIKKPLIAKEKRKENGQKYQLYCRVLPSRETDTNTT